MKKNAQPTQEVKRGEKWEKVRSMEERRTGSVKWTQDEKEKKTKNKDFCISSYINA